MPKEHALAGCCIVALAFARSASRRKRVWELTNLIARIQAGERQAYLTDWGSAFFDPFDLAESKFTTGGRGDYSFYTQKEVDDLLVVGSTGADATRRCEGYFKSRTSCSAIRRGSSGTFVRTRMGTACSWASRLWPGLTMG